PLFRSSSPRPGGSGGARAAGRRLVEPVLVLRRLGRGGDWPGYRGEGDPGLVPVLSGAVAAVAAGAGRHRDRGRRHPAGGGGGAEGGVHLLHQRAVADRSGGDGGLHPQPGAVGAAGPVVRLAGGAGAAVADLRRAVRRAGPVPGGDRAPGRGRADRVHTGGPHLHRDQPDLLEPPPGVRDPGADRAGGRGHAAPGHRSSDASGRLSGGSALATGAMLVLLLAVVTMLITQLVVRPVRLAARTAQRLSAGLLDQRMTVR